MPKRAQVAQAEVISPPLHQYGSELDVQQPLQVGDVLMIELILEVDGVGGDDHMLGVGGGEIGRGQQIGDGFSGSSSSFHQEMPVLIEGPSHSAQHLNLLGTVLVAGELASEGASLVQHPGQGFYIQSPGLGRRLQGRLGFLTLV